MSNTAEDTYEVRCLDCNELVATERGEKAVHAREHGVAFPCEPCARRRWRESDEPLWDLAHRWYDIAANTAVAEGTQHGYRECANQLEDLLAERRAT